VRVGRGVPAAELDGAGVAGRLVPGATGRRDGRRGAGCVVGADGGARGGQRRLNGSGVVARGVAAAQLDGAGVVVRGIATAAGRREAGGRVDRIIGRGGCGRRRQRRLDRDRVVVRGVAATELDCAGVV